MYYMGPCTEIGSKCVTTRYLDPQGLGFWQPEGHVGVVWFLNGLMGFMGIGFRV